MNPKTHTQLHLEDLEDQKAVDQNLLLNPKQVALMVRKEVALKKPRQGDGLALLKKRLLQNSEKDKNGCLNWKGRRKREPRAKCIGCSRHARIREDSACDCARRVRVRESGIYTI